jgi:hypothetical protein
MAIVFDSDAGTITGLSVGGLPDGIVDAGTLATNSVDSAELIDGSIDNSHIDAMAASKLTGALPAISATNLTSIPAANITGTLPAISATNLTSIPAANITGTLPAISGANLTGISGGKVLQVVSANYATEWSSSSTTYTDTGLTATITPSATSSKILVLCNQNGCGKSQSNAGLRLHLYRDATKLADFGEDLGYTNTVENWNMVGSASISYLDSPGAESAVVYKTQANNNSGAGSTVRVQNSETTSTLTLIEIGA